MAPPSGRAQDRPPHLQARRDARLPPACARALKAAPFEPGGLAPDLPQRARIERVREIYARWPTGEEHGRLDPLTPPYRDRRRARYAEDLEPLVRRHPGILIDPREAAVAS